MLVDIFLSLIIVPALLQNNYNFENFLISDFGQQKTEQQVPKRIYTDVLDVKTTAESILAIDVKSDQVLYSRNVQEVRSIASITKLMTALVFLDHNPGWQKEFYTIASDRRNGGIIHLNTGEILSIRNLFKTALIASDNDAAAALARSTGLTEDEFVQQMNLKAKQLGMANTVFADPTGLNMNNVSTAEDLAKLVAVAFNNETITKTTNVSYYEFEVQGEEKTRTVKLYNTNQLTSSYLDIVGGKTGYLEDAGYCLVVKLKGELGQEIIITVLGSETNFDRFQDIKAIADWVFTNYQWPGIN